MSTIREIKWKEPGRESVHLKLEINDGTILSVKMKCVGSLEFLKLCQEMKVNLVSEIDSLVVPEGTSSSAMIWQEIVLTIKGDWKLPFNEEELCHCRKVATKLVDRAIVYGAHTLEEIKRRTSASTGCGTCAPDVKKLIQYRLRKEGA